MKAMVVLTFDIPTPAEAADVLRAIDPPHLPFFDGSARITISPWADVIEAYLDEEGSDALP